MTQYKETTIRVADRKATAEPIYIVKRGDCYRGVDWFVHQQGLRYRSGKAESFIASTEAALAAANFVLSLHPKHRRPAIILLTTTAAEH